MLTFQQASLFHHCGFGERCTTDIREGIMRLLFSVHPFWHLLKRKVMRSLVEEEN